MAYTYTQSHVQVIAEAASAKSRDWTRHKVFVSYHHDDADQAAAFVEDFGSEFIPRTIGVTDDDDFIDSDDDDYVMRRIRQDYLGDSTVTLVLVGACTWARKYVDWEVYSSLRSSSLSSVNGLLAIQLLGAGKLPDRVSDNVTRLEDGTDIGYGRYWVYPPTKETLRANIEDAFTARTTRASGIVNTRARRSRNSVC